MSSADVSALESMEKSESDNTILLLRTVLVGIDGALLPCSVAERCRRFIYFESAVSGRSHPSMSMVKSSISASSFSVDVLAFLGGEGCRMSSSESEMYFLAWAVSVVFGTRRGGFALWRGGDTKASKSVREFRFYEMGYQRVGSLPSVSESEYEIKE